MEVFPLPIGNYSGRGKIENQNYLVGLKIQSLAQGDIQLSTKYQLSTGEIKNWIFTLKPTVRNNQFQVVFNGFIVGTAECQNEKKICHYQIPNSKEKLEESLFIFGDFLIRTGSKWIAGKKLTWSETYLRN